MRPLHPGRPAVLIDGPGLQRLRLAVALAGDPMSGGHVLDSVRYRVMPGTGRLAAAATADQPAAGLVKPPPQPVGPSAETAAFDSPPPPPEGDQAAVMAVIARAQEGDPDAFGELYDRYVDLVYRYVYYRVASHALAEDLTSETFLRALRRITSFTWQGRDFGAWLVTIARNLIADHYKSGRYRLEVTTADMLGSGADRAEDGPEGQVLESITNVQLLDAVKQLNPEQQECIVLRFLQGLSVAETALAMGKNEGAIKALQYRAVRALGRLLPTDLLG